jgi:hypothetical protein
MPAKPRSEPRPKQQTSEELRDALLEFIRGKFYPEPAHWLAFQKDRPRLLKWVVLWPARWLNERGVTLPPERYQALIVEALLDGLRHGDTGRIGYLPAWLGRVVQSHFAHREDEIYQEAKALRPRLEATLQALAGVATVSRPADPVRELATAQRLLKPKPKRVSGGVDKGQLSLL